MGVCFGKEPASTAADTDATPSVSGPQRHGTPDGHQAPQVSPGMPPAGQQQQLAASTPFLPSEPGEVTHNPLLATAPPTAAPAAAGATLQAPASPTRPAPEASPQAAAPRPPPLQHTTPPSNGNHAANHNPAAPPSPQPEHPPSTHPSPKAQAPRTPPHDGAPSPPAPADQPSLATPPPSFMSSLFVNRRARDPSKPPSTCRLLDLPEPLLIHLASLLDLPDATLLACTCHLLRRLVTDNRIWQSQILQRLHAAATRMPFVNGAAAAGAPPPHAAPGPAPSSPTDLYIPYTTPSPPHNGFMRHRAPRRPAQHAPGERWADAAAALLPPGCQHYSHQQLLHAWQQLAAAGPLQHLQGLYYYFDTGATCTRPLLRRSDGLQATFALVLPGHYEVVWHLKFKHAKVSAAAHVRFDTAVTYHHLHGEPASPVQYGNKSTVWNGAQLSALEHKHGRGSWAAVVVTALKVDRLCQTDVAVKGMDECTGVWVRRVQLRRVVAVEPT